MRKPSVHRHDPTEHRLDDAFVASALVHEPTAAERADHRPVGPVSLAGATSGRARLEAYLVAVGALLTVFLTSVALDRLIG